MLARTRAPAEDNAPDSSLSDQALGDSTEANAGVSPADAEFFTSGLIAHLLQFHNAKDSAVRFRVCQLVAAVFNTLDEDAEIDDDLWDDVVEAMVMRCRDKTVAVRLEAARCLRRLHEPDDLETTATAELISLMHTDKAKDVRRMALTSLGLDKKTLPHIIECTRDVEPTVRRAALRVVAESIEIKALTIAQRIKLCHQGLRDRDAKVAQEMRQLVATRWLPQCGYDVLELLSKFAVLDEEEVSLLIVNALLDASAENGADSRLVDVMRTAPKMDEVQYWQVKEAALLWRAQCEVRLSLFSLLPFGTSTTRLWLTVLNFSPFALSQTRRRRRRRLATVRLIPQRRGRARGAPRDGIYSRVQRRPPRDSAYRRGSLHRRD